MDGPRVALIQFPGSNCEGETKRAAEAAGMVCEIFRWNRDATLLAEYDGYIVGGGWSYQDRVRAGVIAAKEPVMDAVFSEAVDRGKPVLGICNGAQVLVEAGLVPGLTPGQVETALAPNRPNPAARLTPFNCRWVYIKHTSTRCAITSGIPEGTIIPIPVAHGEGRYTSVAPGLFEKLAADGQMVFQYCTPEGEVIDDPKVNPNGAEMNMAGLCNPAGNVLAMMPHPERASFLRQMPGELPGEWGRKKVAAIGDLAANDGAGPGLAVFVSMCAMLRSRVNVPG